MEYVSRVNAAMYRTKDVETSVKALIMKQKPTFPKL